MGRLIDADVMLREVSLEANFMPCGKNATEMALEKWVKKQPTAYNPEKVVEELEKDTTCRDRLDGYIPKYKAIEIVRKGGVE